MERQKAEMQKGLLELDTAAKEQSRVPSSVSSTKEEKESTVERGHDEKGLKLCVALSCAGGRQFSRN